ncbi:MAG: HAD-superfamily hydrolase, subfamily IA, variant 3 [candidate division TM6 bacterium GW2011_GWF2_36_6]|nr:MAG: HAD-superfamily hydrolase, subfamily IA, variant 3 [candidate division TM6 bacterium GW2011_GWF2_36_6]
MNELKHKVKAVIFDMDGTIVKTEHIWGKVVIDVLAECGIRTLNDEQKSQLQSLSGVGMEYSCRFVKEKFGLKQSSQELLDRKVALAHEYFDKHLEFIEGFELFHSKLQLVNIPTSIATNADKLSLSRISNKLQFERFFGTNMYCVADVNNVAKPDPALFLHAALQLGAKPEECIVFEDSLVGFAAAKAAGMKCIGIKNALNQSHLDKVHHAIQDYLEAEEAIKKVSKI